MRLIQVRLDEWSGKVEEGVMDGEWISGWEKGNDVKSKGGR